MPRNSHHLRITHLRVQCGTTQQECLYVTLHFKQIQVHPTTQHLWYFHLRVATAMFMSFLCHGKRWASARVPSGCTKPVRTKSWDRPGRTRTLAHRRLMRSHCCSTCWVSYGNRGPWRINSTRPSTSNSGSPIGRRRRWILAVTAVQDREKINHQKFETSTKNSSNYNKKNHQKHIWGLPKWWWQNESRIVFIAGPSSTEGQLWQAGLGKSVIKRTWNLIQRAKTTDNLKKHAKCGLSCQRSRPLPLAKWLNCA